MNTIRHTTLGLGLGLALACGILAFTSTASAKKPPKPPPEPPPAVDTGVIYAIIEGAVHALNPDGSEQQYLFPVADGVGTLRPSRQTHNGERWFVGWQSVEGTYPDGVSYRYCLVAVSESGAVVPLHDDVLLQPSQGAFATLCWLPGDGAVSWPAMRWEGGAVVEWGLYTLELTFTADGSIAAGSPALTDWTAGLFELWYEAPPSPWLEGYYLLVDDYDWSPDGGAIAYSAAYSEDFTGQLYVADESGDVVQLTDEDSSPADPRWSPDGTRIAFKLNQQHQIDIIDLAQATRSTLVATTRSDYREQVFLPVWSPSSTHLVYSYFTTDRKRSRNKTALHIIAADGSDDTALTGSYDSALPLDWCVEE